MGQTIPSQTFLNLQGMIMITAKCIGASLGNYKAPLYTFECEIPRIIVAELNKHRALSNSIESSRAVPLEKMIDKVRDNMFIPVFTKNQAGMQGYKINKNPILSDVWEEAAMSAVDYAEELFLNHGIHKQVCNRLIENFTYVKCILSGTDWDNFFNLRIHHTAEPHIRELAIAIYKEMRATVPMKIEEGEWHVPYIERKRDQYGAIHYRHPETKESLTEDEAKDLSVAMCAQVSYRNIDSSDDKVRKVLDRLFPLNEPIHAVPCEHVATPADIMEDAIGNFYGWIQYRHTIKNNTCYNFTHEVFEKRINEINKLMG